MNETPTNSTDNGATSQEEAVNALSNYDWRKDLEIVMAGRFGVIAVAGAYARLRSNLTYIDTLLSATDSHISEGYRVRLGFGSLHGEYIVIPLGEATVPERVIERVSFTTPEHPTEVVRLVTEAEIDARYGQYNKATWDALLARLRGGQR